MTKYQILLIYDYQYENRNIYYDIINFLDGIVFNRIYPGYLVNSELTEVTRATISDPKDVDRLLRHLHLVKWDYPQSVSLLIRSPNDSKFREYKYDSKM